MSETQNPKSRANRFFLNTVKFSVLVLVAIAYLVSSKKDEPAKLQEAAPEATAPVVQAKVNSIKPEITPELESDENGIKTPSGKIMPLEEFKKLRNGMSEAMWYSFGPKRDSMKLLEGMIPAEEAFRKYGFLPADRNFAIGVNSVWGLMYTGENQEGLHSLKALLERMNSENRQENYFGLLMRDNGVGKSGGAAR